MCPPTQNSSVCQSITFNQKEKIKSAEIESKKIHASTSLLHFVFSKIVNVANDFFTYMRMKNVDIFVRKSITTFKESIRCKDSALKHLWEIAVIPVNISKHFGYLLRTNFQKFNVEFLYIVLNLLHYFKLRTFFS